MTKKEVLQVVDMQIRVVDEQIKACLRDDSQLTRNSKFNI